MKLLLNYAKIEQQLIMIGFYVGVTLINLSLINPYYHKIITRDQMYNMFDLFNSKADNYDADSVNNVIDSDTNIFIFDGKGYGIKDCIKVDDGILNAN